MSVTSTISSRWQITLPKTIRERENLETGQQIAFVYQDGKLTLLPLKHTIFDFAGSLPATNESLEAIQEQVMQDQAEQIATEGTE